MSLLNHNGLSYNERIALFGAEILDRLKTESLVIVNTDEHPEQFEELCDLINDLRLWDSQTPLTWTSVEA